MRSKLFVIFVVCLSKNISAQKNLLKFDAFDLFQSKVSVSFEHLVGKNTSLQLTSGLILDYSKQSINQTGLIQLTEEDITQGWYIAPEMRYYLTEMTNMTPPVGAYINFSLNYEDVNSSLINEFNRWTKNEKRAGVGGGLGMQWILIQNIGLELEMRVYALYQFSNQSGSVIDGVFDEFSNDNISRVFNSSFSGRIVFAL